MFRSGMKLVLLGGVLVALATLPAPAAPEGPIKVDLKLVIATDVSLSINAEEAQLQREGIAEVFLPGTPMQDIIDFVRHSTSLLREKQAEDLRKPAL